MSLDCSISEGDLNSIRTRKKTKFVNSLELESNYLISFYTTYVSTIDSWGLKNYIFRLSFFPIGPGWKYKGYGGPIKNFYFPIYLLNDLIKWNDFSNLSLSSSWWIVLVWKISPTSLSFSGMTVKFWDPKCEQWI